MILRWPHFSKDAHVRTCQECGHAQTARDPRTVKGDAWRDLKCKLCKSEAMDYGSANTEREDEE